MNCHTKTTQVPMYIIYSLSVVLYNYNASRFSTWKNMYSMNNYESKYHHFLCVPPCTDVPTVFGSGWHWPVLLTSTPNWLTTKKDQYTLIKQSLYSNRAFTLISCVNYSNRTIFLVFLSTHVVITLLNLGTSLTVCM